MLYHSFGKPNLYVAGLQMEQWQATSNHKPAFSCLVEIMSLELKVLRMKTEFVSGFSISSAFTLDIKC